MNKQSSHKLRVLVVDGTEVAIEQNYTEVSKKPFCVTSLVTRFSFDVDEARELIGLLEEAIDEIENN